MMIFFWPKRYFPTLHLYNMFAVIFSYLIVGRFYQYILVNTLMVLHNIKFIFFELGILSCCLKKLIFIFFEVFNKNLFHCRLIMRKLYRIKEQNPDNFCSLIFPITLAYNFLLFLYLRIV